MTLPEPYDLLVILAGDKPHRHPAARELIRRRWARHLAVTGEHEWIDAGLEDYVLAAPPSVSTYQDAQSIRALVQQHGFTTVLVVTSAAQAERARLVLARALAGLSVTLDVLTLARAHPADANASVLRAFTSGTTELVKLAYYRTRRRV